MKFVQYNPATGDAVCYGETAEETLRVVIAEGQPLIVVDAFPEDFALHLYKVDLKSKRLVRSTRPRPDPRPVAPTIDARAAIAPISDAQFFTRVAVRGIITQEDALKASQSGFIPPAIAAFIETLQNPDTRFLATMLFSGETTIYRQHPLIEGFLMDQGMGAEDIDAFFTDALAS